MQGHGFEVEEAEHGERALSLARAQVPSLIISDFVDAGDGWLHAAASVEGRRAARTHPLHRVHRNLQPGQGHAIGAGYGRRCFLIKPAESDVFMSRVDKVLYAASQREPQVREPVISEQTSYKVYNEVLVTKLEKRSTELEQHVAELQKTQAQVLRVNRLYAALSETNQAIVHSPNKEHLFDELCRIAVQRGGFALAWVGWIDPLTRELAPVARSGPEPAWFARLAPLVQSGAPRTPAELVLAQGEPYLSNDLQADPALAEVADDLRYHGFQSAASFPLRLGERVVGSVSLFACERDFFDRELRELVAEMVSDVAFALSNFSGRRSASMRWNCCAPVKKPAASIAGAVEASANGIMIAEVGVSDQPLIYVNPAFERITGYSAAEVRGRNARFLMGARHGAAWLAGDWRGGAGPPRGQRDPQELPQGRHAVLERADDCARAQRGGRDHALCWHPQ